MQKDVSYPQGCRTLNTAHVSYNAHQKTMPQSCPLKSFIILIKPFNVHLSIALKRLGVFLVCFLKKLREARIVTLYGLMVNIQI